jgi:hypothetical protein
MQGHVHQLRSEGTLRNQFSVVLPGQIVFSLCVVVDIPDYCNCVCLLTVVGKRGLELLPLLESRVL